MVVTTHSPYILSAFNNLLYAYQIGAKKETVSDIVDKQLWINPERTAAYFISENFCESIMDEELQLIQAEKIDSASRMINERYDKLFELDE